MFRGYIIGVMVIALLAALFFVSPFLQDLFFAVAEDAESFAAENAVIAVSFFIVLGAFSAMISPFSSTPIIPVAVALWGFLSAIFLLIVGWLIGDTIAYMIGRYAGHPLIAQFVKEEKLKRYEEYFSQRMTFLRALLLRLALPAEIGYGFGLIRYRFGAYVLVTALAEIPFAILAALAAEALINVEPIRFAGLVFALAIIVGGAYLAFRAVRK